MNSGKIKIELDREDALLLRDFLGRVNFYIVGAALSHGTDNAGITEDDAERHMLAVNHAYLALEHRVGPSFKRKTNGDHIRTLPNEEMAECMSGWQDWGGGLDPENWLEYLQQPWDEKTWKQQN